MKKIMGMDKTLDFLKEERTEITLENSYKKRD
jgi:hypothetical protein